MRANLSIRHRRVRKKPKVMDELPLTSMLDIFVIILVFLLKSHSTSTTSFSSPPGIELPPSISQNVPPDSHHLIITAESMTFEDERIMDFVQTPDSIGSNDAKYEINKSKLDEGGLRVLPLYDALIKAKQKSELLRAKSKIRTKDGQPLPFDGVLAIQADKTIDYLIIRKVLYTAGAAGYRLFRFLAVRKGQ